MDIGALECDEVVEVWEAPLEVLGRISSAGLRLGTRMAEAEGLWISISTVRLGAT